MASRASSTLSALSRAARSYGPQAARRKLGALDELRELTLPNPTQVHRLHEILCFLRAYPDDRRVHRTVHRMLEAFSRRADLRAHREALYNTGIAGTDLYAVFYYPTARWLARRWPDRLHIDWESYQTPDRLAALLPALLPASDALSTEDPDLDTPELIRLLAGPGESDGAFLVRRIAAQCAPPAVEEKLFDDLEVPMVLTGAVDTPSRTRSRQPNLPIFHIPGEPGRDRDWRRMRPCAVRDVSPSAGRRLVDLGRAQMITRNRDLYAFMHADARDVRLVDMGDGLEFAVLGLEPAHRFLLETMYICIALQSGVPVGYMQATALLRSAELNFNIFDTFRGAQARHVFRAFLALVRHIFGSDTFIINTQQLGEDNPDALKSGAWWFYQKFGFRPRSPEMLRIVSAELRRKRRNPGHRSDLATLKKLAAEPLQLSTGRPRAHTVSSLDLGRLGRAISRRLSGSGGSDREAAIDACATDAARRLGLPGAPGRTASERAAWRSWAPLVLVLPGVDRWPREDKRSLAAIACAKGGRRESDYLSRFDAHPRLKRAIIGVIGVS